tara:strand:+ start:2214 stop:3749 length:1536 start_codon:yes stop_codon:yes gene_type:complete
MDNSDKKINVDTLLLIDDTLRLYKEFISKPTSKTLNNFIDAANKYKESYIEDSGKYASTNANDIVYGPEFGSLIDGMDAHTKNKLFGFTKSISTADKKLNAFHSSITRLAARRDNEGLPEINDIQILNRAILHFSQYPEKPFQNAKSIREEAELKINSSAIKRFQKEDQDGNTKGPLKLFSKKTKVPEDLLKSYGIEIDEELDFTEFNIIKYQHYIHDTKETKKEHSRSYYRAMPRRVYFEADKGSPRRFCWFESRKEFQYLARHFIDKYSKNENLIDKRIGLKQEMYNSKDLTHDQFLDHLNEFSLNEEEYKFFKEKDFNFLVFAADYNKSPRQMLTHINRSGTPGWIDVCLYNDTQVTIRSFTNDIDFIPRVSGHSPDDFTGDIIVMSNEMPKLSHQALNFFSSELDNDYRMLRRVDFDIVNDLASEPDLTLDDISRMEGLEANYILSILKDILNRDNFNFDWLDDPDLVDANGNQTSKEIVIQSIKKLVKSQELKTQDNILKNKENKE